ncbi:uncharacterized protein B0I36DRAFT_332308 [Microdochium trichocladiopsis]|uniref:Secreted protein n=1 Tax=Microdochium trichocladiopsis TaxID=1682393 RepID=A0A9P8XY50_9PEZI|nr:uncharacterized protein B0I36DRAFT_332308 [Microdochium trichocladiopsis]KAH7024963.1 hypothetical protein B0I36DRAFT_332308 [Microdochium trichocladiopsis]
MLSLFALGHVPSVCLCLARMSSWDCLSTSEASRPPVLRAQTTQKSRAQMWRWLEVSSATQPRPSLSFGCGCHHTVLLDQAGTYFHVQRSFEIVLPAIRGHVF